MVKTKILRLEVKLLWQARRLKKIHFGDPDKNLYDLGRIFLIQVQKDDILERAGSMAFSYTIALFPMMLFLLNPIPYLQDIFPYITTHNLLTFTQEILPEEIYSQSESTIMDI